MRLTDLTAARRAELLARYPNEPNATLRAEFGLNQNQLNAAARQAGVRKTAALLTSVNSVKRNVHSVGKRVYNAVGAAGRAGLALEGAFTALPDAPRERVQAALYGLTSRGTLYRTGERGQGRWFVRKEWADEHLLQLRAQSIARVNAICRPRAPDNAPRIQCPPVLGPHIHPVSTEPGLFKNLGPGQYIDGEAKSWASAITRKAA